MVANPRAILLSPKTRVFKYAESFRVFKLAYNVSNLYLIFGLSSYPFLPSR